MGKYLKITCLDSAEGVHVSEKLDDVVDVLAHALARVGVERRPAGQFVVGAEVLLHAGRHQQSARVLKITQKSAWLCNRLDGRVEPVAYAALSINHTRFYLQNKVDQQEKVGVGDVGLELERVHQVHD